MSRGRCNIGIDQEGPTIEDLAGELHGTDADGTVQADEGFEERLVDLRTVIVDEDRGRLNVGIGCVG